MKLYCVVSYPGIFPDTYLNCYVQVHVTERWHDSDDKTPGWDWQWFHGRGALRAATEHARSVEGIDGEITALVLDVRPSAAEIAAWLNAENNGDPHFVIGGVVAEVSRGSTYGNRAPTILINQDGRILTNSKNE